MRLRFTAVALVAVAISALLTQAALAADQQTQNKPAITGTMQIDFTTRMAQNQEDGAPKKGVKDYYTFDLTVNPESKYATRFNGKITRQPRITQLKVRTVQAPQLDFEGVNIEVPKASSGTVGTMVGVIAVDEKTGAFNLNNPDRQLRIDITKGRAFTDPFGGVFYGKADDKSGLSWASIKRKVGGKEVEVKFQADPIKFQQTKLAKGPFPTAYPSTLVAGELSYDRETANYYARNLTFRYTGADGKEVTDTVSGTIKWVEDPSRKENGKGRYEFNLRFNEEQNQKGGDEAQFAGKNDDDLFFAVDNSIPSLVGNVEYQDTMNGETVTQSKVTYKLEQNKLNDTQVMNFAKAWLLISGPANDE
jgi:hypothetical protein